jgi:hypothetical protein
MAKCAACGTEGASRWFFFKTPAGVVAACSHACREVYLGSLDDGSAGDGSPEDEDATALLARLSAGSGPDTDSEPR